MKYAEYKAAVYELAVFNATLTKGYRREWTEQDFTGYSRKNEEIQRLVGVAVQCGYPVVRSCDVIYFLFDPIQISFHVKDTFGLPNDPGFAWDGVKNAWTYTEGEYLALRAQRAAELAIRQANYEAKKATLEGLFSLELQNVEKRLRRAKKEETVAFWIKMKEYVLNGWYDSYAAHVVMSPEFLSALHEYRKCQTDSYILNFSIG